MAGLSACGGGGNGSSVTPQRGDLVSVTSTTTIDPLAVNAVLAALALTGVDTSALQGTYGVSYNRIVYKTVTPDGRLIDASGVVGYPLKLNIEPSPIVSYQHPTIFQDAEAPSQAASTDSVLTVLAGTGYIVAMPDYIGYGASTNEVHTYVHAQGLAAAVVDMLRATRRLLASRNVRTNGQLFLTGYSEGGYATLAAQKEIEQNLASEFTITASMPGAGPYDMSATAQYIVGLSTNDNPQIAGFVFKAYDRWHGWNRLQDASMFQSPYNTVVNTYYDGTRGSTEIRNALTTSSANLFATTFHTNFLGGGEATVKAGFAANDIYNWAPARPTRLFHGEDDTIVPYSNATTAVSAMTTAGSTSVTLVSCSSLPAGLRGHENCVPEFLGEMFNWFDTLANNL
jgi:pimeloyl-ACP methyl ester carboxylesterase